jgi:hypothetical protein
MRNNNAEIERYRLMGSGNNGAFKVPYLGKFYLGVIASDGKGWDHVSISLPNRCPTWDEMCFVKDLFFEEDETVVQFHPRKSQYVNSHPFCLHLWKLQGQEYELPMPEFV